ncbi:DNA cytosine methyltransferase [Achromobacter denitrificans]|uniref:DNA cytosine methyltransferase n=1 Tax=Achromobacter denitrificans TaxID=32002 RepID=UPI003B9FAF23
MAQAGAYYNEIDPYAADWLRNLIAAGHIAPGDVDERSIEDVHPDDIRSYTQCHFFAGIGVWSYALRRAGWPDDRPVWTGSCPCQPFSAAGKGTAFDDERHLWPAWHWLIQECRPPVVFGEQVASKDAEPWLDLVSTDLEALAFAVAACAFPSASIGAPHIRDRTYFMAHAGGERVRAEGPGAAGESSGCTGIKAGQQRLRADAGAGGAVAGRVADADGGHAGAEREQRGGEQRQQPEDGGTVPGAGAGPVNGFWGSADWLLCRDGKWRPVEPGTFPLAHGAAARVGRLRAYGNAINAQQAQIFIEESMRCI